MQDTQRKIKLSELLWDIIPVDARLECDVIGLALDSNKVKPGDVFFACVGEKNDGRTFIDHAIANGAVAVIGEALRGKPKLMVREISANQQVPIFALENLPQFIGKIAARFYDYPSRKLDVIGVTGTNGKTSCCHFIAQALEQFQRHCAVIGTIGNGFLEDLSRAALTTPDAISLQRLLAQLEAQKAKAVAMEISSHALDQGRVNGIDLQIAMFTNLSRDHLDYHHDMASYAQAKRRIFNLPFQHAVINADDDCGVQWLQELRGKHQVFGYSLTGANIPGVSMVSASGIKLDSSGMVMGVHTPWGAGLLRSSLLGKFNLSNLLAVLTSLCIMGIPLHEALQGLAQVNTIAGRMEAFGGQAGPLIVVDYAHTPHALGQALLALREHCQKQLWCVFGCGGDRDRGKRVLMGQVAEHCADRLILTDDNPRNEAPEQIICDIANGLYRSAKATVIHNRADAIKYAISHASAGDVILVAGKGHEDYQLIGDERRHFSDREVVQNLMTRKAACR